MGELTQASLGAAAEGFHAAGLGQASWDAALEGLAAVTGSTGAQLIDLGAGATAPLNVMTGVAPEAGPEFVAVGGADPAVNSRVRIGLRAPELAVLDETAFTVAEDMRRNADYAEWVRRYDLRNSCVSNLVKAPDHNVGLALLRGEAQGNVSEAQKRAFTVLAPHARAAVRTRMALDAQGAQLLAGAMEAVRATALLCDAAGRVRSMTASAEALISAGDVLRLRRGVLTTACETDRRSLEAALGAALSGETPAFAAVARRLNSDDRLFIEVTPLPASIAPGFGARALIIIHGAGLDERRIAAAAASLYGLSASEAAIAAQLAAGRSPAAIAHARQVSVGTVRSQVRRIYDKVGVSSQLELAARLPRL